MRIAIAQTLQTHNAVNIFHAQLATSSTIAQADLDTFLTTVQAAYKTRFNPRQGTDVANAQATAVLYAPGGTELLSTVAMTGAGSGTNAPLQPSSAAVCVSWISNVYWRGGKPRTYFALSYTGDVLNHLALSAAGVTSWTTAGNNFRADVQAAAVGTITGVTFGFVSFRSGNADRTPPVFYPISGARVHSRIATQRRRLGRPLA